MIERERGERVRFEVRVQDGIHYFGAGWGEVWFDAGAHTSIMVTNPHAPEGFPGHPYLPLQVQLRAIGPAPR